MGRSVCRALRAAVMIGAAASAWPRGALAQDVGVVAHAPPGAPTTADELRAALARTAGQVGVRGEGRPFSRAAAMLADGAVAAERLEGFARVEALADEGWRGYLEARFADAATHLLDARRAAGGLLDLAGAPELVADLSLRLGAVELALGRERDADRDLRLAAALDPERAVTDAEFKPAVVDRYRAARSGARRRWPRRIEVAPAGAEVEVDGRAAGAAPLDVELEEGAHVVVARAPGRAARGELIAVGGREPAVIRLELAADPLAEASAGAAAALRIGDDAPRASGAARALIAVGELDGVLVAASIWRRGRPALLGQLCRGEPLDCGAAVEVDDGGRERLDAAALELWREALRASGGHALTLLADARLVHRETGPAPLAPERRAGAGGFWRSRWLWVGVGGFAVSLVAAGLVLGGGGDDVQWTISSDGCQFGRC
ncbi:MAG TPA: PEGA domain-containing protein [Kofleriaceae bacterium]|nr:PEGA domain-containing protein [Kofleriaceae bacterium]